jgi:uncharacterized membrane protein
MTDQVNFTPDITSDDKLWAALTYVFSPIIPILLLLLEDKKNRPFIKAHNVQALIAGIVLWVIGVVIAPLTCGISFLVWVIMLVWAYRAYQGQYVNIPIITEFVKNQGWA